MECELEGEEDISSIVPGSTERHKLSQRGEDLRLPERLFNPSRILDAQTKPDVVFSQKGMGSNAYHAIV